MRGPARLATLVLCALLAGCGGFGGGREEPPTARVPAPVPRLAAVQQALLAQHEQWQGVPYRLGGEDRKGLDCSGFTQLTYRERFGIELPRDTTQQRRAGHRIVGERLQPGDLLFFRTGNRMNHVGMYVGNWQFLHVSTSVGVMLSSLREAYWSSRFTQAVRVPGV